FYGMKPQEEVIIDLEPGKSILVKLLSVGTPDKEGIRIVFFSVNGENRFVRIKDKSIESYKEEHIKADEESENQYGAPLQGSLYKVLVKEGQKVKQNDHLFIIEAMKMETSIVANKDGVIKSISLEAGTMVMKDDLMLTME